MPLALYPASSSDQLRMAEEWTTVAKKVTGKNKHRYTEKKAQVLENMAGCRNLAPALRSDEIEQLFEEGWEYDGVRKSSDDAFLDQTYIYKFVPVKNNPWGDLIILRQQRAKNTEDNA